MLLVDVPADDEVFFYDEYVLVLVDVLVDEVFYLDIVLQCLDVLLDDELPDLACLHVLVWLHVHGVLSDVALHDLRGEDTSKHQAQTLH